MNSTPGGIVKAAIGGKRETPVLVTPPKEA